VAISFARSFSGAEGTVPVNVTTASFVSTLISVALSPGSAMIAVLTFARIERFALADAQSAAILWMGLALIAVVPNLLAGRNTDLDLPTAFDVPPAGTTRLDLG